MRLRNMLIGIVVLFGTYKIVLDGVPNLSEETQKDVLFGLACTILVLAFATLWTAVKASPTDGE